MIKVDLSPTELDFIIFLVKKQTESIDDYNTIERNVELVQKLEYAKEE